MGGIRGCHSPGHTIPYTLPHPCAPSQLSTYPQPSHADTTLFSLRAKDLTRGKGAHNYLLAEDNLAKEVVELMEEGEVNQGEDRGDQDLGDH